MRLLTGILLVLLCACQGSQQTVDEQSGVARFDARRWSKKNLATPVFSNGDSIPEARTPEEWRRYGSEEKAACCSYENNPANDSVFGKMYNWYAIADPRGLAPKGWHVATKEEWDALNAEVIKGAKIKSRSGWDFDGNGDSAFDFNALPAGERHVDGEFSAMGALTVWRTATAFDSKYAWNVAMYHFDHKLRIDYTNKAGGESVRIVRD